jgi:hypothetical protein
MNHYTFQWSCGVTLSVKILSYGLDDQSSIQGRGNGRNFSLPASYAMGTRGSYSGGKLATHHHLVPLPQYIFTVWCLIKQEIYINGVGLC